MGQYADDITDGLVCSICGALVDGDAPGHPRKCGECATEIRRPTS